MQLVNARNNNVLDRLRYDPPPLGCVLALSDKKRDGPIILDNSPYGNHGTIMGATWKRLPSGLWVNSFDGTDDKINAAVPIGLFTTEATLLMWIKLNNNIPANWAQAGLIMLDDDGLGNTYPEPATGGSPGSITLGIFRDDRQSLGVIGVDKSKWHLLTVTNKPGANNWIVYQNGSAIFTAVGEDVIHLGVTSGGGNLQLGTEDAGSNLDGFAIFTRIFNRALSTTEIANIFNSERHLFNV